MSEEEKATQTIEWLGLLEIMVVDNATFALSKEGLKDMLLGDIRKFRKIAEEIINPSHEQPKLKHKRQKQ